MYSWQKNQWQHIMQQRTSLPHALLLRGSVGTGKEDFALALSRSVLCRAPVDTHACGVCVSCNWFKESHHPDFRFISPEDADTNEDALKKKSAKSTQISVGQIRQLIDYLNLSSHEVNRHRVILISPAEALNVAAANSLLKMLEEPPANTLFLLVSNQPQRLLATIVSRCQAIDMPLPIQQEALDWLSAQGAKNAENILRYSGGAPLLALKNAENDAEITQLINVLAMGSALQPASGASLFLAIGMERAIDVMQKWVFDLIAYKLCQKTNYHLQYINSLQGLCKSVNLNAIIRFQQLLNDAKKTANHPLSNEIQLENLLLCYTKTFNRRTG